MTDEAANVIPEPSERVAPLAESLDLENLLDAEGNIR